MVSQYQLTGLTGPELEAKAKEKGLTPDQIQALKARMAALNQGNLSKSKKGVWGRSVRRPQETAHVSKAGRLHA